MLSTKAFAELCDSTKRTIIHYDRIGLLKPASRKGSFRHYQPKQVLIFQKIKLLKSFGLNLAEIKKYLHQNNELARLFRKQQKQLSQKKLTLEKRLAKIDEFLANLKKGRLLVDPKIKKVTPYSFYGIKKEGRYVDIDKHQRELFSLIKDKKGHRAGLTVFFQPYYSPHEAEMVTGAVIGKEKAKKIPGVEVFSVPAHKAVSYKHVGPYSYMSYLWQFLDKFVVENKLKRSPRIPCREFYIVGPISSASEDDFVTELQIPVL